MPLHPEKARVSMTVKEFGNCTCSMFTQPAKADIGMQVMPCEMTMLPVRPVQPSKQEILRRVSDSSEMWVSPEQKENAWLPRLFKLEGKVKVPESPEHE